MVQIVYEDENEFRVVAEDQCWDAQTLQELKDKYGIIFQTKGDGVSPVLVRGNHVVIGEEDDGKIIFLKEYGQFTHAFSKYWVPYLVADLLESIKENN